MISTFVALNLFLHGLLGCCWHHTHSCVSYCCERFRASAQLCPRDMDQPFCAHRHHNGHNDRHEDDSRNNENQQPPTSHYSHRHCEGEKCFWLWTETLPSSRELGAEDGTWLTEASLGRAKSPNRYNIARAAIPPVVTSPLMRSHLLLKSCCFKSLASRLRTASPLLRFDEWCSRRV